MTSKEYHEALNIEAGKALGWEAVRNLVWCWQEVWDPTHNSRHIGMLLAKVLDDKTVTLFEIYADDSARHGYLVNVDNELETLKCWERDASSWRIAVVKTLIVACGGELPEEPDDKEEKV